MMIPIPIEWRAYEILAGLAKGASTYLAARGESLTH